MRSALLLSATSVFVLATALPSLACTAGPQCASADSRAQGSMAAWERLAADPSVHISSMVSYCSNAAVVEVARICEREMRASGDHMCADQAAAQASASQDAADSALMSARASAASSSWQPDCSSL